MTKSLKPAEITAALIPKLNICHLDPLTNKTVSVSATAAIKIQKENAARWLMRYANDEDALYDYMVRHFAYAELP